MVMFARGKLTVQESPLCSAGQRSPYGINTGCRTEREELDRHLAVESKEAPV